MRAIALLRIIDLRKPRSSCQTCIMGTGLSALRLSMTAAVPGPDPSSAMTISPGITVCESIPPTDLFKASGQL